jgi:hypothetical protein
MTWNMGRYVCPMTLLVRSLPVILASPSQLTRYVVEPGRQGYGHGQDKKTWQGAKMSNEYQPHKNVNLIGSTEEGNKTGDINIHATTTFVGSTSMERSIIKLDYFFSVSRV